MYLSRLELNVRRHETMRLMVSPQVMHSAIMASFPSFEGGTDRVLWRVDNLGPSTYVIVQSEKSPDFQHMVDQFGWPASGQRWDTLNYDQFLDNINNSQIWRFRLAANPVHSVGIPSQKGRRGKVLAHVTADQQKKWLLDRASKFGFSIMDATSDVREPALEIKQRETKQFSREDRRVTFSAVTFEGILKVEDADLMVDSMKRGIGRAKGYGCGLLTVARM
ncbi:MAG: type I-E CRISPR-associated protein Cas6/Cse3/CasE [Candidatus Methanoplasma sp.]|nr:type I-E CRISPR-associated protein Cas6/Cse3/CasE [Candidatus Methanoplasma sp.]